MTQMEEQACEDFASSSWASMDPELKEAACSGDVDFLKTAIASSKPAAYFLSRFTPPSDNDYVHYAGNILHIAIWRGRVGFVTEAMSTLPEDIVRLLLCQQERAGHLLNWNPLHVAAYQGNSSLVELIANCGNGEVSLYRERNGLKPLNPCPDQVFVAQDSEGRTPALLAIQWGNSNSASILTSGSRAELIKNVVDHEGWSPLYWAVCKGLGEVVLNLLECQGPLCCSGPDGSTVLHAMAGLSSAPAEYVDDIYQNLFTRFPELITNCDNNGFTVLHKWVEIGCNSENEHKQDDLERLFKYFFAEHHADAIKLMLVGDSKDGNNPLHVTATTSTSEFSAVKIAPTLIGLYKKYTAKASNFSQRHERPWLMKNKNGDTPLLLAIRNKLEDLAWCFLQHDPLDSLISSGHQENPLMLAIHEKCYKLVVRILGIIAAHKDLVSLLTFSDGSNILHFALASPSDYPETVVKEVVEKFPFLISQPDSESDTPLDKASECGAEWVVELMLKKDPLALQNARHGWKAACQKGHLRILLTYLEHCPYFRGFCLGRQETPLHHIKLDSYAKYQEFLVIHKVIEELRNTRDTFGDTPLHKAIKKKNIELAEALLTMDDVRLNIKDKGGQTAMDLLAEECKHDDDWICSCYSQKAVKIFHFNNLLNSE